MRSLVLWSPHSLSSNINDQLASLTATIYSFITSLLNLCAGLTWTALTTKGDNPSSKWEQIKLIVKLKLDKVDEVSPEVAFCIDGGAEWGHAQRGQVRSCPHVRAGRYGL